MEDTTSYESSGDGEYYDNYDDDYNDYGEPPHSYLLDDDNVTTVAMETVSNAMNGFFFVILCSNKKVLIF